MAGEFKLEEALPWGRNRVEYTAFFDLGDLPSGTRILDVAAGPSSFTAEMTRLGYRAIAADPLYRFTKVEIAARILDSRAIMVAGLREREEFATRESNPLVPGVRRLTSRASASAASASL